MRSRRSLFLVSLGHFIVDSFAGFFPMYIAMRNLDLVKAGLIVTTGNLVSNLLQPFFGMMADRFRKERILMAGMIGGPLLMSLIGVTDNYAFLALFVISGNIMISLYHPAATDMATSLAAGERSPLRFSFFSFVGTVGFAFTGLYFQTFCRVFGFGRSWLLAAPAVILALLVVRLLPPIPFRKREGFLKGFWEALKTKRRAVAMLYCLIVIQSSIQVIMTYSLPTLYREWGFRESLWSVSHLLFVSTGAVAVIIAGLLAKRVSPGRLIVFSMALDVPLWYLFLYSGMQGRLISLLWLALLGFTNFAAFPAMVVLGQRQLPDFGATISGIMMGAAWGVGGLSPFLVSVFSKWADWDVPGGALMPGLMLMGVLPLAAIGIWTRFGEEKERS